MKAFLPAAMCGLVLAGCANTATTTAEGVYALGAALDTAEKAAIIYESQPGADPALVAHLKTLDAAAYAAVAPLVANGGNVNADALSAAQAAVTALTQYLTQNGAK